VSIRHFGRHRVRPLTTPEPGRPRSRVPALIQDSGAIRLVPPEPAAAQTWSAADTWASAGPLRTQKPRRPPAAAIPPPAIDEVRLNRNILVSLRRDYAQLPLFRAGVADRFVLHQLAMRAPSTISGGNHHAEDH